ncbi:alcohol dehydrogenase catalytic domain-containing protein [Actinomadura madurae]|uniref:alcohol dehydrogenase catalytic domain-containing protein n=1 Tax=Actinomadura madurae TaxID=1993 RepID=UPI0035572264
MPRDGWRRAVQQGTIGVRLGASPGTMVFRVGRDAPGLKVRHLGGGGYVKAVVYERYGRPDVLRVEDVSTPSPAAGQVLVKVAATSINLSDWEGLCGSPFYARLGGLRAPRRPILGSDIAGWVEAVGTGVTQFQPGDEVYGDNLQLKGGFAQYAVAPESVLALKPAELTFAEASTIPQGGAIAVQGTAGVAEGHRVLINGARRGHGCVRHPVGQASRCTRDRCRQRPQARIHAVTRGRCSGRLSERRLHA